MLTPEESTLIETELLSPGGPAPSDRTREAVALVRRETIPSARQDGAKLTAREDQVLVLLVLGHRTVEVAAAIGIDRKTVETHRGHLLQKLGLRGNVELAYWAVQHGRVTTEEIRAVWSRPRSPRLASSLAVPAGAPR